MAQEKISLSDFDFTDLQNYPNVGKNKKGELEEFSFKGNFLLRPHKSMLAMTEEAKLEKAKCADDYRYFIENYVNIQTIDHGVIKFKLRDFQKEFLDKVHNNPKIIGKLARQVGKTTSVSSYIVWCLCFKKDFNIGIVANTSALTSEIVGMIKQMFELLPAFLKPGVKVWNARSITLSNGCRIISAVASGSALRGRTINLLLCDEVGFIDETKIKAFFDSVMPALSSGKNTKIILISTPNGYNTFYNLWQEAIKGLSGYKWYEGTWRIIPGRDEAWKQAEIAATSYEEFMRNHEVSFLGSSKTLISAEALTHISSTKKVHIDTLTHIHPDCKVYRYPSYASGVFYSVGVDSAKISPTSNRNSDYVSVQVLEFNLKEKSIKQAMTLKTRDMHYTELAEILFELGTYYNNGMILVENNSEGQAIVDTLFDKYEYENIYSDSNRGDILGFRTTQKSKRIGLSNLKQVIEKQILEIYDVQTINEFYTFVRIGNTFKANSLEAHDDTIMALVAAIQFLVDEMNEMELTLWDLLETMDLSVDEEDSEEQVERIVETSTTDIDFFKTSRGSVSIEDMRWLLGS